MAHIQAHRLRKKVQIQGLRSSEERGVLPYAAVTRSEHNAALRRCSGSFSSACHEAGPLSLPKDPDLLKAVLLHKTLHLPLLLDQQAGEDQGPARLQEGRKMGKEPDDFPQDQVCRHHGEGLFQGIEGFGAQLD